MYGVDLYGMYRGELGLDEVMDLVANLPPGCATYRAIGGPASWSEELHAHVAAIDVLREANWQRTEDGMNGRNHPRPIDRPVLRVRGSSRDEAAKATGRAEVFLARQEAARAAAAAADEKG